MVLKRFMLLTLILSLTFLGGCIKSQGNNQQDLERAKSDCIKLCNQKKAEGLDLSDGPCLSDQIADDTVCDVAHWPRQNVDNVKANQCPGFGKSAHHFIEVDTDCNYIRSF